MSSLFFTLFTRFSIPGRFLPLFYKFHGLSSSETGAVISLCNFSSLISTPFFSWVADVNKNHHNVIILTQVLSLAFFLLQPLGFFLRFLPLYVLGFFATLESAFKHPSYSIISAISLEFLHKTFGKDNGPLHFGSMRLWGAVSWAVSNSILGILLDFIDSIQKRSSIKSQNNIHLLKVFYALCPVVVLILVVNVLYEKSKARKHSTHYYHAIKASDEMEDGTQPVEEQQSLLCPTSPRIAENKEIAQYGMESYSSVMKKVTTERRKMQKEENSFVLQKMTATEEMDLSRAYEVNKSHGKDNFGLEMNGELLKNEELTIPMSIYTVSEESINEEHEELDSTGLIENENLNIFHAFHPIVFSGGIWTAFFFWLMFAIGIGMNIIENLFFVFFREELGASFTACGLSVVITVIFEIILFANSEKLFRIIQPPELLIVGSLSFVVRTFGYFIIPSAYYVLALEPLHGLTYAAVHASSVAIISSRTPDKYKATGQSILSILSGLSSIIGTFAGGFIIEYYGSRSLYAACSIFVFFSTLSFAVIVFTEKERNRRTGN